VDNDNQTKKRTKDETNIESLSSTQKIIMFIHYSTEFVVGITATEVQPIRAAPVGYSNISPYLLDIQIPFCSFLITIHIMSDHAIAAPSRELDEFEELVFQYTGRMGLGNEEVCAAATHLHLQLHQHITYKLHMNHTPSHRISIQTNLYNC
jgi:hypothetical protein